MQPGAQLIHEHDLYFDGGDPANGSLYLCAPLNTEVAGVDAAIEQLREAGLWSQATPKQVPVVQKDAYAQQMQFIDSFEFKSGTATLKAARFDHPKYPSDAQRWSAWKNILKAVG
jgi:hypothetical protein